jgi:hypothetical protein
MDMISRYPLAIKLSNGKSPFGDYVSSYKPPKGILHCYVSFPEGISTTNIINWSTSLPWPFFPKDEIIFNAGISACAKGSQWMQEGLGGS